MQETERNKNGKAAHSAWRNYDDFNEYFWLVLFSFVKYITFFSDKLTNGFLANVCHTYVGHLLALNWAGQ